MANLHSGRKQMILAFLYAGICVGVIVLLTILLNSFNWFLFFAYLIIAVLLAAVYCFISTHSSRRKHAEPGAIYPPSFGTVDEVELIKNETISLEEMKNLFDVHDALRIGITPSWFRSRKSRAPIDMKVVFIARDPDAVTIGAMAKIEELVCPIAIRWIAKNNGEKIFTGIKPDELINAGDIIGNVSAPFRTEMFLPAGLGIELVIKAGSCVSTIAPAAWIYPAAMDKIRQSRFNDNTCKEIKES